MSAKSLIDPELLAFYETMPQIRFERNSLATLRPAMDEQ